MEEVWKDINGYEGLYQVSNCGRVRSLKYGKQRLLKQAISKDGYLYVVLYKDRTNKHHYVHRLVATEFCLGANEFRDINHLDKDRANNYYKNLEWCSHQHNTRYSLCKKVRCIELDITFDSLDEAAEYVNGSKGNISSCALGKRQTCKGYHWEYVD